MHGLVEAPRVGGEAEVREDLALHVLLRVDRELALEARVVDGAVALGDLGDERHEARLQLVETARTSAVFMPGSKSSSRMS